VSVVDIAVEERWVKNAETLRQLIYMMMATQLACVSSGDGHGKSVVLAQDEPASCG
jgi:hypothetical protein